MVQGEQHYRRLYLEAVQDVTQPQWGSGNVARWSFRKSNQVRVMDEERAGGSGREGREGPNKQQAQFNREQLRGNLTTSPSWPVTQIPHQQGRIRSGTNRPAAKTNSSCLSLPGEAWRHFSSCRLSWTHSVSKQVAVTCRVGCPVLSSMLSVSGPKIFLIFHTFAPLFADTGSKTALRSLWLQDPPVDLLKSGCSAPVTNTPSRQTRKSYWQLLSLEGIGSGFAAICVPNCKLLGVLAILFS